MCPAEDEGMKTNREVKGMPSRQQPWFKIEGQEFGIEHEINGLEIKRWSDFSLKHDWTSGGSDPGGLEEMDGQECEARC